MNPHRAHHTSPLAIFASLWTNRQLILQMTKREIAGRYTGSLIGSAWSFIHPLLMLIIYTFVFSVVFKSRWGADENESKTEFAIILFAGMIVFNIFSEVVNRAPSLILSNVNYVKKVVFPLEILPWVALGTSLFHAGASLLVLLGCSVSLQGCSPLDRSPVPSRPLAFDLLQHGTGLVSGGDGGLHSGYWPDYFGGDDCLDVPLRSLLPGYGAAPRISSGALLQSARLSHLGEPQGTRLRCHACLGGLGHAAHRESWDCLSRVLVVPKSA